MTWSKPYKDCGAKGTRTPDLLVAQAPPAWPGGVRQRLARCMRCIATHRRCRRGTQGGDPGVDKSVASNCGVDGLDQLIGGGAFEEKTSGACLRAP
jgi:hypothetical protein